MEFKRDHPIVSLIAVIAISFIAVAMEKLVNKFTQNISIRACKTIRFFLMAMAWCPLIVAWYVNDILGHIIGVFMFALVLVGMFFFGYGSHLMKKVIKTKIDEYQNK